MPRHRDIQSAAVVYRTARAGLRLTRRQRRRLVGLLISAGEVWACVLELNAWRRARQDAPLAGYQALCRELAAAAPGCFGKLDSTGAGRCCAGIPTPGSPPPPAAATATPRRGSRGGAGR